MLVVKLLRHAGMNKRQWRLVVPAWLAHGVLAAVLLAFGPATLAAQRVALVIGNAAYQHETTLKNPLRDAELIARTLKDDLRFDVVQRVNNGKRVDLVREIAKFRAAAAGAEVAVVYYSGHGMMNSRRQNFLLPVDMPNSSADASADGDVELDANAVSEDALIAAIDGAGVQVVVLDACRTNAIVRRGDKNADKGLSRRADQSRKRLIVYATEEGRVAEDGAGANSTFADSLARNLKQTSWPVMKVMTEVANEVERGTKGKQSPTWSGNLRVDIYLVNPTITVNNNAGASGAPGATTVRSDPDEEAWKAAQGADTVEGYEQYLSDFGTGRNVSAAKIKLVAAKRRETERIAESTNSPAQSLTRPDTSSAPLTSIPHPRLDVEAKQAAWTNHFGVEWSWPVTGTVTSNFNAKAPMKGIDIKTAADSFVRATASGKVIYIGNEPRGYGEMIVISHGSETTSVYFHLGSVQVKANQRVVRGEKLGRAASADGKVHFEIRRQGSPIDPIELMPR